jgi:hypothetical protein
MHAIDTQYAGCCQAASEIEPEIGPEPDDYRLTPREAYVLQSAPVRGLSLGRSDGGGASGDRCAADKAVPLIAGRGLRHR